MPNLLRSNFSAADLRNSDLSGSNFALANLNSANLRDTVLDHANFTQADLTQRRPEQKQSRRTPTSKAPYSMTRTCVAQIFRTSSGGSISRALKGANIAGVRNAPKGFVEWALKNGAVDPPNADELSSLLSLVRRQLPYLILTLVPGGASEKSSRADCRSSRTSIPRAPSSHSSIVERLSPARRSRSGRPHNCGSNGNWICSQLVISPIGLAFLARVASTRDNGSGRYCARADRHAHSAKAARPGAGSRAPRGKIRSKTIVPPESASRQIPKFWVNCSRSGSAAAAARIASPTALAERIYADRRTLRPKVSRSTRATAGNSDPPPVT